jgi:hypothetical protein
MKRFISAVMATALLLGTCLAGQAAEVGDANAVLDRAIKAIGGEEKLGKIKGMSWKAKGILTFMENDNEFTSEWTAEGIDRVRSEFEGDFGGNKFRGVTVLAGDKGWRDFGGELSEMDRDALANEKRNVYLALVPVTLVPLKGKEFKLGAVAEESVGGKPAVSLKAIGPDGKEFTLFFDRESHLPIKTIGKVIGFMGDEFTQEAMLSDYREMGGIKKATKIELKRNGETFITQQITEFKLLDTVDPKTFAELK